MPYISIDSYNIDTSTWLRYVNCARHPKELNVSVAFCRGRVFYITSKHIVPGVELLNYYGDEFAIYLNVDPGKFDMDGHGTYGAFM